MDDTLQRLRDLCMALPEVTERHSHGMPTWFVRDRRTFVNWSTGHHDARPTLWCAAPPDAQQAHVATYPERYFVPPYVGPRGWLGVYLDVPELSWAVVAEHVLDAYQVVAPRRLAASVARS